MPLPSKGNHYNEGGRRVNRQIASGQSGVAAAEAFRAHHAWKRLRAWCIHNRPGEDWREVLERSQLYVIRRPLNLSAEQEVVHLAPQHHPGCNRRRRCRNSPIHGKQLE